MLADVSEEQWIVFVPQKERRVRLVDRGVVRQSDLSTPAVSDS